jgi:hypothetical protein
MMSKNKKASNVAIPSKAIKLGEKYHMLSFHSNSHRVLYGEFSKLKDGRMLFKGDNVYKIFKSDVFHKNKTGQPIGTDIINGRLKFVAFFLSNEDAESSAESTARNAAFMFIKNSIDYDQEAMEEMHKSIMHRMVLINHTITAKSIEDMSELIYKSYSYDSKIKNRK